MEVLHQEPRESAYVPLSEHQSQTPQSFYAGPPVLYHRSKDASLVITREDAERIPVISKLVDEAQPRGQGDAENNEGSIIVETINTWVTSEKFIIYHPNTASGLSIPYPSISLHAIQRLQGPSRQQQVQGLYMQIATSDGFDDHDPDGSAAFTLIPSSTSTSSQPAPVLDGAADNQTNASPIQDLFSAVSACANLHPDPASPSSSAADGVEGEEPPAIAYESVDGLPPAMPGSGGWITADNMHEFFDEEGNWRGEGLGPGAGIVRGRDEEDEEEAQTNGDGESADGPDETKWRRTG